MKLKKLQEDWNLLGERDPFWAILTDPQKRNGKWELIEFFQTGEEYINKVMQRVDSLGISLKRGIALDFGCGVGRLTQALCRHFDLCYGIDIAPSMIDLAKEYNRYGEKCKYYVNDVDNLELFEDNKFDLICSTLVLQHMRPEYSMNYIKEFLRVLKNGGLVVFQLPSERKAYNLPKSAFRARIALRESSITAKAGTLVMINVSVKNISNVTWPSGAVNLGNHWLDQNGLLLVRDDARASLPANLEPMKEAELTLVVKAPSKPGDYLLEFDMVQEMVAWFGGRGSEVTRIPVKVVTHQQGSGGGDHPQSEVTRIPVKVVTHVKDFLAKFKGRLYQSDADIPTMEMYGVHKDEVIRFIKSCGGRVVYVQDDGDMGGWHSFHYYVTK